MPLRPIHAAQSTDLGPTQLATDSAALPRGVHCHPFAAGDPCDRETRDEIEELHEAWNSAGRPARDRWTLHVTTTGATTLQLTDTLAPAAH